MTTQSDRLGKSRNRRGRRLISIEERLSPARRERRAKKMEQRANETTYRVESIRLEKERLKKEKAKREKLYNSLKDQYSQKHKKENTILVGLKSLFRFGRAKKKDKIKSFNEQQTKGARRGAI